MHELAICEGIVSRLLGFLAEQPGAKISRVSVEVGKLSGIDPEALSFSFPLALESAGLGKIELDIERKPVTLSCPDCGAATEVKNFELKCSVCGSVRVKISGGRELKVKSFEVEHV